MFIQSCEQNKDAFKVYYAFSERNHNVDQCHIRSRWFVEYFADMLGVAYDSESLCFSGSLMEDGKTVEIDLNRYEIISYHPEQEAAT